MQPTFDGPWRARALAGDPDAVRALTDCALPALYRFCHYRVGRDTHLCEEVVQETLVRALRDLPRYDPGRSDNQIMPWLTGLARNAIQRALNRHRATVPLDALWARADEELRNRFDTCVPVVEIDGRIRFRGRVDPRLLRRILRSGG